MPRPTSQATKASIFAKTTARFAVTFRVGSHLRIETSADGVPFTDRDAAWSVFQARGRDPRFDSVRLVVRGT